MRIFWIIFLICNTCIGKHVINKLEFVVICFSRKKKIQLKRKLVSDLYKRDSGN